MRRVTLEELEGIESIALKTETGQTIVLKSGEPVLIKDPDRHLVAAIERLPVTFEEAEDEDGA